MPDPEDDDGALLIRQAERRDTAELRDIYNHFVNNSTAIFDLVPRTIDEHSGGHPAVVAVDGGRVVGFGSLSTFRERPAYATTVEDSVYLLDAYQGRA